MTQTLSLTEVESFLKQVVPLSQLSDSGWQKLLTRMQVLQYRLGQTIFIQETMPTQIGIVYQGQARLLGYAEGKQVPVSLAMLKPGSIIGWISLVRGVACETVIASEEMLAITLAAGDFQELLEQEAALRDYFYQTPHLSEVFSLIGKSHLNTAEGKDLRALTLTYLPQIKVMHLPKGVTPAQRLDQGYEWLVSSGDVLDPAEGQKPIGSALNLQSEAIRIESPTGARLLGIPHSQRQTNGTAPSFNGSQAPTLAVREAPAEIPLPEEVIPRQSLRQYPYFSGRGPVDGLMMSLKMLAKHLGGKFKQDVIERIIVSQYQAAGSLSLQFAGFLLDLVGLSGQLVQVPVAALNRLKAPALIQWQDSFAVIYRITPSEVVFASPESGGVTIKKIRNLVENLPDPLLIILVKPGTRERQEKFSLWAFWPYVKQHSGIFLQVFVASFFILAFSLAQPLIVQVIIDKVLGQNAIDTLYTLGFLMLGMAIFESVLTALRTYLFVDTTNRIDLAMGSQIIDHLLRLPLSYFDQRRVGELSTRINELENIRSFTTGTALTAVLDAFFSLAYIAIMFLYSWKLTLVALCTVPFFILLAFIASPIIRKQLRVRAERHADTQSYLVEAISGIQTVKAQNIELKTRWQWQEKYARYVNAGFRTVLTSSWASSISSFLNNFSSLAVLWVGAFEVLNSNGKFTLGQLIAFRIISGYVTQPLLRLAQLWQNFQEVGMSIERLADIVDAKEEVDESDRDNIPMPEIKGEIKFEEVCFRFSSQGPLQLANINLHIPAGSFVGIVGQSGSGKSTLTKLIPRLYSPLSGRILIDGYDISKVELYSLRRQIGMVLQDTLLFNGTVMENIALTSPEATSDQIIEAAKIAAAHDFIMTLPNGYNTVVGERGTGLSGGQRQRIAIARTILQKPRLLILDEATSALDYDSERQVCNNLAEACAGRTVLFITHRLNTIKNADMIIMMDQGAIVEMGTHRELMQMRGRYYCLYMQQESQT
ncbi:MAG: peptidase domain-containing ABC transporter [Pseudanabaenaceae cyanobacterium]